MTLIEGKVAAGSGDQSVHSTITATALCCSRQRPFDFQHALQLDQCGGGIKLVRVPDEFAGGLLEDGMGAVQ